jgi:hypothetical protein
MAQLTDRAKVQCVISKTLAFKVKADHLFPFAGHSSAP